MSTDISIQIEKELQKYAHGDKLQILAGADLLVAQWLADQLGEQHNFAGHEHKYTAIALMREKKLIAGIAYFDYRWPSIEMAVAQVSPKWVTRGILTEIFNYPFEILKCNRVTAKTDATNLTSQSFLLRLGFKLEGTIRQLNPNGTDVLFFGLLKSEWEGSKYNGQRRRQHEP